MLFALMRFIGFGWRRLFAGKNHKDPTVLEKKREIRAKVTIELLCDGEMAEEIERSFLR